MKLIIVEACGGGIQVAKLLGYHEDGRVRLTKWRAQGQCWTQPALYPPSVVRGPVDPKDKDHARRLRKMGRDGAFTPGARS